MTILSLSSIALAGFASLAPAAVDFDTWRAYDASTFAAARYPKVFVAGDLNGDGSPDVVAAHMFNSGWLSVLLNDGEGGFLPPSFVPQALGSWGLELCDVDGDGDLDVLAANSGSNWQGNGFTRYLNAGDGSLGSPASFASVGGPSGLAVADFDGDGHEDVAVAGYGFFGSGSQVAVHLGDGAGGFGPALVLGTGAAPYRLAAGDLNGDGRPELVVARENKRVSVHLNQGGALGAAVEYTPAGRLLAGDGYPDLALFDVDHDGDLDVGYSSTRTMVTSDTSFGALSVLHNDGTGALVGSSQIPLLRFVAGPSDVHVADLDADGWADILGAHGDSSGWSVALSDGQGGYLPAEHIYGGQVPMAVLAADVDSDAALDVLVLAHHSLEVTVHRNLGGGSFHHPRGPAVNPLSSDIDLADVDGDGDLDAAMTASYAGSGNVEVAYNDGAGGFTPGSFFGSGGGAFAVKLRDLDGDGAVDLLWADSGTSPPYDFWTATNDGAGAFGPPVEWAVNTCGNGDVDAFDMDGDGDLDVFLTEYLGCIGSSGSRCYIRENLGGGVFAPAYVYTVVLRPERIGHGDLDGDGNVDVVFTDGGGLTIGLGDGAGGFGPPMQIALSGGAKDVEVVDFDADGVLDLVASSWSGAPGDGARVSMLRGLGGAAFGPPEVHLGSYSPNLGNARDLVVVDVDGDGDPDVATLNEASNGLSLYRNLGNGTFADHERYGAGPSPSAFAAGDLDSDGVVDLAVLIGIPPAELDRELAVLRGRREGAGPPAAKTPAQSSNVGGFVRR